MYKSEPLTRRGSLRSLRSAPLLSTVLESTLSLTRIHPITSLELPGLDYAFETQSVIGGHHRELGTSLHSGVAGIATSTRAQSHTGLLGRLGPNASFRHTGENKRTIQPKRALSRNFKPHIVADTVKQYISRAQRVQKDTKEQQPNMEFLRGVYAFMQVSRSSIDYEYETATETAEHIVRTVSPSLSTTSTTTTTITSTTTTTPTSLTTAITTATTATTKFTSTVDAAKCQCEHHKKVLAVKNQKQNQNQEQNQSNQQAKLNQQQQHQQQNQTEKLQNQRK